jgi:nicotinamidase/pyrazinamidase
MVIDFAKSALIEVDVQVDFCPAYTSREGTVRPAGALAVPGGDRVVAPLNALAEKFAPVEAQIVASQDWHPPGHVSFAAAHPGKKPGDLLRLSGDMEQILWPAHCVMDTAGAQFHEELRTDLITFVLRKGYHEDLDSYSVFFENDRKTPTGLEDFLQEKAVDTLVVGGLATDYCVFYSVMDGLRLGYRVILLTDAVAGVDFPPGSVERALKAMGEGGALLVDSGDLR